MEVNIKQVSTYNIEIEGMVRTGFTKVSEWEGFIKFQNKDGIVICSIQENYNIFSSLVDRDNNMRFIEGSRENVTVVSITTDLIPQKEEDKKEVL